MTTPEIAARLVELCRTGDFDTAINELYADCIISVEPSGPMLVTEGIDGVRGKNEWWYHNFEMLTVAVTDPRINQDQFIVQYTLDVRNRETGELSQMAESALYRVAEGKIVHESFYY